MKSLAALRPAVRPSSSALRAARQAQAIWAKVPVAVRMRKMSAFVDAMLAMNQEVVPEIAEQMGRPVKWGGEFKPFEQRARHMISIAADALAPRVAPTDRRVHAVYRANPRGRRAGGRAVELSLSDSGQ